MNKIYRLILLLLISGTLTACIAQPSVTRTPEEVFLPAPATATLVSSTATPSPSPTPLPARVLTVCLGQEPSSLFLYGTSESVARSVLQAIYDGPFDYADYQVTPVILQKLPTLADGDARLNPIEVAPGTLILDTNGNWVTLQAGVTYRPSGCTNGQCALTYEGDQPVWMDELVVQFQLLPGLQWSDGVPLKASDSVYSYQVYRSLYGSTPPELLRFTRSYLAMDEHRVEWTAIPGYQGRYNTFFFSPLPEHVLGWLSPQELLTAEGATRAPLGWGPYVLDEWVRGDHITLSRSETYFRGPAGLPHFDYLVFRFTNDPGQALDALLVGECDLVDRTAGLEAQMSELVGLQQAGRVSLAWQSGTAWELLSFGLRPADPTRPALFGLPEVRQAIAGCLDRQALSETFWWGLAQVPDSYVDTGHPEHNPQIDGYPYDPQAAAELLTSVGWLDHDLDPLTARIASGVPGVVDGTAFEFTYLVPEDGERPQVAQVVQASLARCGLQAQIELLPWDDLLNPGPDGLVFGRQHDLAQYAWATSLEPACHLFMSAEIPGPYPDFARGWGGANAAGFNDPDFDRSCLDSKYLLPDFDEHQDASGQAQQIFAEQLPALPLYQRLKLVAMRPDLCGLAEMFVFDNILSQLERLDYGSSCGR